MRGFQEDGFSNDVRHNLPPKQALDLTIPVWRVAEILLRYNELASKLAGNGYELDISLGFEGLAGRRLISLSGRRMLLGDHIAKQETYLAEALLDPKAIQETLPETVDALVRGMYELFDFFRLPASLAGEEIGAMLSGRG